MERAEHPRLLAERARTPPSTPRCCARSAQGIKAVDPGAKVVTAGLNESELGIKLVPFLQGMYRAGGKGSFDVLALHPYAPGSDLVMAQISRAVRELRRNGDPARTLGDGARLGHRQPVEARARRERGGPGLADPPHVTELARFRGRLRLDGIFYFNWRDVSPAPGSGDHWGLHTGLFRQDGSAEARAPGAHGSDLGDLVGLTSRRRITLRRP